MINVVYSTSDFYAMCTGISIYSLFENNTDLDINVDVIVNGVSSDNINRLKQIGNKFNRKVNIIDNSNYLNKFGSEYNLPMIRNSYSTYFRLILHDTLPYDKVLVIDSDTLVVGSIRKIFEINIDKYLMLAVPEAAVYSKYQNLEDEDLIEKDNYYYNMGIVLVNLKKWRDDNVDEYLKIELKKNKYDFKIADQSIINRFLSNYIGKIDLKYNYYTPAHRTNYKVFENLFNKRKCFTEDEFNDAQKNPVIIHFFGHSFERPWFVRNASCYEDKYIEYLKKTDWVNIRKTKWLNQKKLYTLYDYLCYLILKMKKYDFALVFRYKYGQIVKSILRVKR
ncbi:MAG: glycosyltransferase family 8 protein [Coprobacillus cateniformis]|nr:glycosyltransferase family 8 protein [Coprobacillus cateniformis]